MAKISHFAKNINAVKENYRIWQSLDGQQVDIYFDTADIIDLLIGMRAMSPLPGEAFRWKSYHDAKQLVYAMAYKGWLGPIRLLPPHLAELYDLLNHERFQTINKAVDIKDIEDEFWNNKNILSKGVIELVRSTAASSDEQKKEWLEQFIKQSPHIFQGAYLMDRSADWRERYAYLKKNKSLIFDQGTIDMNDLGKTPLFEALNTALNRKRKVATANNYVDALALCMFDRKVQTAEENNEPPPFFYAEQKHVYEAVQIVAKQKIGGRYPFMSTSLQTTEPYSVVRSADFFFLYGILKVTQTMFTSLWEPLEENMERIAQEKNEAVKKFGRGEADNQLRLVFLEFFQSWWNEQGIADLKQPFSGLEIEANEESLRHDVEHYIENEFKELRQRIRLTPEVLGIMRQTLISLNRTKSRIRELYNDPFSMHAAHEFGPRFSFGPGICDDIQERFNELKAAAFSDSETDVDGIKSTIVSSISEVLTSVGPEQPKDIENMLNRLAGAMGILWLLNKFELIDRICRAIREMPHLMQSDDDKYPSSPFAIMHVAAILTLENPDMKEVDDIIACVTRKYGLKAKEEDKSYKIWLALSYAHYRVADRLYSKVYMAPEDLTPAERESPVRNKALAHLEMTLKYAQAAHKWLNDTILSGEQIGATPRHNRYLRSAINNIIFCQTILLPSSELQATLGEMVNDQELFAEDPRLWHENRFSDTVARYYYRLARIKTEGKHVDKARDYNRRSLDSKGLSEKSLPNQLAINLDRYFPIDN